MARVHRLSSNASPTGSGGRHILGRWTPGAGAWLIFAVFLIALVPRVVGAGSVYTVDEHKWIPRSVQYYSDITHFYDDYDLKTYTPGVTTVTLVGLPLKVAAIVTGDDTPTRVLAPFPPYAIPLGQLIIGVTTAVLVAGAYALLRLLIHDPLGPLIGALLLALDPFFLAHSRVVHTDALVAGFGLLSILAFLLFVERRPRSSAYLAMSGVFAALASLTKVSGLIVVAFIGLYYLYLTIFGPSPASGERQIRKYFSHGWIWGAGFVATSLVVWPMLLLEPLDTVTNILKTVETVRTTPHPVGGTELAGTNFFMGQIIDAPSRFFYPVVLAHKATPVVMAGFILGVFALVRPVNGASQRLVVALLAFALFSLGVTTFTAKQVDRYILPLYVALILVAGVGLARAVTFASVRRGSRFLMAGGAALLAAYLIWSVVSLHPHYLAYNNEVLGGTVAAQKRFYVGWGEGLDLVADYLNEKEEASDLTVALMWNEILSQMFKGRTVVLYGETPDYVVLYSSQSQLRIPRGIYECYSALEPEKVVYIAGAPYAQIYRVTDESFYRVCSSR